MTTASEELHYVRPLIVAAIDRLTKRDGLSSMDAYDRLGAQIGKSERWVRKVIGWDETAGVRLRDAWKIEAAYERLCARVEAAADASEARLAQLQEDRNASRQVAAAARLEPGARGLDAVESEGES